MNKLSGKTPLRMDLRTDTALGVALSLVVFCVYLTTLGPSIGFIDSGELAAAAYTFGVAHPTGYPLFTMAAGTFSHLTSFLGGSVIWRLNLLAALCCAASVFFFFRVFLSLLSQGLSVAKKPDAKPGTSLRIAATIGALVLAFSRTFWSQSVGVEVYSAHLLLISLVLFLFLKALSDKVFTPRTVVDPAINRKAWFAFSFVLGLSFANHMTTLLLLPGLLYLYFVAHGFGRPAWKNAALSAPFFGLGLLPYLYLPLRAAAHPAMNWGAITDFDSFLWHISGKQYSGWMFSSLEPAGRQLSLFVNTLASEFGYLALLPALAGLIVMFRRSRRLFTFILLLFAGCLLYSINYDIPDIVNYFLLAYITISIMAVFGIHALLQFAEHSGRRSTFIAACIIASLCFVIPLSLNYRDVDESGNYAVEDYTRTLLNGVDANAVILTTQWDHFVAAAFYLQLVEHVRPDVVVIDRELLRRSWYHRYLSQRYPWLTEASRAEISAFLPELYKFEKKLPYDPAVIQGTFENMVRSFIENSLKTRPVYTTPEIEPTYLEGFGRIPSGVVIRVFAGPTPSFTPQEIVFRPFPKDNLYFQILAGYYATAFANQGVYLGMHGVLDGSEHFLRRALVVKPDYAQAAIWLQQVKAEQAKVAHP